MDLNTAQTSIKLYCGLGAKILTYNINSQFHKGFLPRPTPNKMFVFANMENAQQQIYIELEWRSPLWYHELIFVILNLVAALRARCSKPSPSAPPDSNTSTAHLTSMHLIGGLSVVEFKCVQQGICQSTRFLDLEKCLGPENMPQQNKGWQPLMAEAPGTILKSTTVGPLTNTTITTAPLPLSDRPPAASRTTCRAMEGAIDRAKVSVSIWSWKFAAMRNAHKSKNWNGLFSKFQNHNCSK